VTIVAAAGAGVGIGSTWLAVPGSHTAYPFQLAGELFPIVVYAWALIALGVAVIAALTWGHRWLAPLLGLYGAYLVFWAVINVDSAFRSAGTGGTGLWLYGGLAVITLASAPTVTSAS
jgi:cytochrome c oxidase assembly factor CtaG